MYHILQVKYLYIVTSFASCVYASRFLNTENAYQVGRDNLCKLLFESNQINDCPIFLNYIRQTRIFPVLINQVRGYSFLEKEKYAMIFHPTEYLKHVHNILHWHGVR